MHKNCFVIQPFDKDKFDKRFDDHIAPAIEKAGLKAYRVDRDPSVRVPIESIHLGIGEASICLADITTNNPNVWYELGYALASRKEVILVCSHERQDAFPFDVRHLNIIHYNTGSGRDFTKLEKDITTQITARLSERQSLQTIAQMSPLSEVEGLSPHETAALVVLMANPLTPESLVDPWAFKEDMERAGFTPVAVNLSLNALTRKNMVDIVDRDNGQGDSITAYKISPKGIDWLLNNQSNLSLRHDYDDSDPFANE